MQTRINLDVPKPTTKRKLFSERRSQLNKEQLDHAAQQAFNMLVADEFVPDVPECGDTKCKGIEPIYDPSSRSYVCGNCAVVISTRYITNDPDRHITDSHTGETVGGDARYHKDDMVHIKTDSGDIVTRTVLTATTSSNKRQRQHADPIESAIKRAEETSHELLNSHWLRLENNEVVATRTKELIHQFIHVRTTNSVTGSLKTPSTTGIAIAALRRAGLESGIGIRLEEIHNVLGEEKAPKTLKDKWSNNMTRDLNLDTIPKDQALSAYLTRYQNMIRSITPQERQSIHTLCSWVKCMLWSVTLFPYPHGEGKKEEEKKPKNKKVRVVGHVLPDGTISKSSSTSTKKKKSDEDDDDDSKWLVQLLSHTDEIRAFNNNESQEIGYWCKLINPSNGMIAAEEPLPITTTNPEWHIRRVKESSLAACIVWLILRLRPVPSKINNSTKTLSRRQLQRQKAASTATTVAPTQHRYTQQEISRHTGVATASISKCRKALHSVWNHLINNV